MTLLHNSYNTVYYPNDCETFGSRALGGNSVGKPYVCLQKYLLSMTILKSVLFNPSIGY